MQGLQVTHIRVRQAALDAEIRCPLSVFRVSNAVADLLLTALPRLGQQVCVDGLGDKGPVRTFTDEIVGTETPHLLEHLAIELMGEAYSQIKQEVEVSAVNAADKPSKTSTMEKALKAALQTQFMGHTSWLEEYAITAPKGYVEMRVTLTFCDDLVCMAALKEALRLVNMTVCSDVSEQDLQQSVEQALLRIKTQIRTNIQC